MKLSEVKIGEKFYYIDKDNKSCRMHLRINMTLSQMSLTTKYPDVVCALDLTTYEVVCHNPDNEVEVEHDNVYI